MVKRRKQDNIEFAINRYSPPHGPSAAVLIPVDLRQRRVHRRDDQNQ